MVGARAKSTYTKTLGFLRNYAKFIGPGIMVSVAYMDPGNYATGITAGASNRFSLLFFVLLSNIIAIFLQTLCIKLGSVTGYDLARCCREHFPRKVNYVLWFLAECAIIATDVAEVIGSAIALNILLRIPLPAGVVITIIDVLFVMMAYRNDTSSTKFVKLFEYVVAFFVMAVVVCFSVELSQIPMDSSSVRQVFRGFAPSKEMFQNGGLTVATSIVGATVMIHSLFLGSGIVQPRLREYDMKHGIINREDFVDDTDKDSFIQKSDEEKEKYLQVKEELYFYRVYRPSLQAIEYCLKYSIIELVLTLFTFALFVNLAILIVAGATLYGTEDAVNADLYAIHDLLSKNLAPVVGTVFMLALLFSGQSAGIVCTIAGQIVSEGHINWTLKPWLRRLVTRSISIVPCLIISICIGKSGLDEALNVSQIVISILLPPLTAPLIYFTSSKKIMSVSVPPNNRENHEQSSLEAHEESESVSYKDMSNSWCTTIILCIIWVLITVLNVYAIVDMGMNGVQ